MEVQLRIDRELIYVTGKYTPEEYGLHTYPNGDPGYPGTPSEFHIEKIEWETVNGTIDITSLIFTLEDLDLEELICDKIEK